MHWSTWVFGPETQLHSFLWKGEEVLLELAQIHPLTNCGKFHCELHVRWYQMDTPVGSVLKLYWDLAKSPTR